MKFQNPFVISDEDKKKLSQAGSLIADVFPSVNVDWKPGRAAINAVGKAIPSVKVSWKDKESDTKD
jgi:hypothetical protein